MSASAKTGRTPGPWNWLNYPDGRKLLTGPDNAVIHCPGPGPQMGITEPDQALVAAAPDIYAVARDIEELIGGWRELIAELDDMPKSEALGKAMWAALDQIDQTTKLLHVAIVKATAESRP